MLAELRLWETICRALGLDELAPLSFADRLARTDELNATIAEKIAGLDADEALDRLVSAGAPVTPVLSPEGATRHPQLRARGFHVETADGLVARLPARLSGDGLAASDRVAELDGHRTGFSPR